MRAIPRLLSLIVVLAVLLLTARVMALTYDSVTFSREFVSGASVCVIQADLNDPTVKIDIGLPAKGIAHSESFAGFVKRHAPLAAVTGIYFDMRTLRPTGTIVTGGKTIHESNIGTAVCFTPDNKVRFVDAKFGESCDLSRAECGFRTGPRLLANGQYALNPSREGFRHPGLFGARTRMALGVTSYNKLLLVLVRTPVTFSRLATIMKTLGALDAVCLDGGTSSAMYYKGLVIKSPGRLLTNVVEVLHRTARFDTAASPGLLSAYGVSALNDGSQSMSAAVQADGVAITISAARGWQPQLVLHPGEGNAAARDVGYEPVAMLADPIRLRFSKCLHSLFPVNRA